MTALVVPGGRPRPHRPLRTTRRRRRPGLRSTRHLRHRARPRGRRTDPRVLPVGQHETGDEAQWRTEIGWPIQDAAGLGWRLADVVTSLASDSSLDQYAAERRQVGLDLLLATRARAALRSTEGDGSALRTLMSELIATVPELSRALAERTSGLHVKYDVPGHPLTGSRAPDLPLVGDKTSLFAALHDAQPVAVATQQLLDSSTAARLSERSVSARSMAHQERVQWRGVTAALIRPDGYVAWATEADGTRARDELIDAAARLRPGID